MVVVVVEDINRVQDIIQEKEDEMRTEKEVKGIEEIHIRGLIEGEDEVLHHHLLQPPPPLLHHQIPPPLQTHLDLVHLPMLVVSHQILPNIVYLKTNNHLTIIL